MSQETFGQRAAKARQEAGYSITRAAAELGTSYSHLYRIEADEVWPSIMKAKEMAKLYRVSLDWLANMPGREGEKA